MSSRGGGRSDPILFTIEIVVLKIALHTVLKIVTDNKNNTPTPNPPFSVWSKIHGGGGC